MTQATPGYIYAIVPVGWFIWAVPFFRIKRGGDRAQKLDRRARWGILLEALGYFIMFQSRFWTPHPPLWRTGPGILFLALAGLLSWTSARALGKQWRFDAGLNADHQLVQSGAYRFVRHPIYTSMLCLMLGTGLMIAPFPILAISATLFVIGAEIRVRIEDALLASRFGEAFGAYRGRVPAYIPFLP
jgi:protein-S-isoprenylcysteine O-methyltransferase Ste14